jgi:hypothetical protein
LIDVLMCLAAVEGLEISLAMFCRRSGAAASQIYRYFESWGDLREQAGLPREIDRSSYTARYSSDDLLAALRSAAEQAGSTVGLRVFSRLTGITAQPIYRVFGSWKGFKEAAGLPHQRQPAVPLEHTHESMLNLVRKMLTEHGGHLTQMEFCELTGVKRGVVYRCGGWERLRVKLGHFRNGHRLWLDPDDPLHAVLRDMYVPPPDFLWTPGSPSVVASDPGG